ncbi:hypothetical protein [Candidatus Avelusimicrobium sp.]|uniref:hypothetical protein n=1 Tax=Candidatus Avelusimicrobium sp. TaxID=3048833 RepID=UPI003F7D97F0
MNNDVIIDFLKQVGIEALKSGAQKMLQTDTTLSTNGEQTPAATNIMPQSEYEDGDAFVANLQGDLKSMLQTPSPEMMVPLIFNLTRQLGRVVKFTEVQENKRNKIIAERDVLIKHIEAEKAVILEYLDKSFDERKENFNKLFAMADEAIASENNERLALILNSINFIAVESPFKALRSVSDTKKALADKKHTWDF